ncbi:hypothetical protein [Rhizobium sp. AG855]|uniref:hypothetical protein n=1 Tax=Rhizobium sp. AG855 TaxID=2183898 RepID=UPI0011C42CC7|nr:hypothetical protein [Rhizobium sp. AG855]
MWTWIAREAEAIVAIATVLGLVVTVVGFGLTISQLQQTTKQLQAANEYQIRKDLRDLVQVIGPKMRTDCIADTSTCEKQQVLDSKQSIGLLFNFYQSVYRQAKASGISAVFRSQMADDFCQSFERPEIAAFWDAQVAAKHYKAERVEMRAEWCSDKKQ